MSNRKSNLWRQLPQAISYAEIDEVTSSRGRICGPINFDVFSQRYKSNEYPGVNYKTQIWNGNEFKEWTPIFNVDHLFKRLDLKLYNKRNKYKKHHKNHHQHHQHQQAGQQQHHQHQQQQQKQHKNNKSLHKSNNKMNKMNKTNKNNKNNKIKKVQQIMKEYKNKTISHIKSNKNKLSNYYYMSQPAKELFKWLLLSRGCIFLFGIVFTHILIDTPFDTSSLQINRSIIRKLNTVNKYNPWPTEFLFAYFGRFSHWDGEHFLNIAEYGYLHEKMYAFLPGLPLILNSITLPIKMFIAHNIYYKSLLLLCGVLWNSLFCSYCSCIILYHLTNKIYNKPSIALITSKLFLINPASIFFCSIYTESMFSFVSFLLFLVCELKYFDYNNLIRSASASASASNKNNIIIDDSDDDIIVENQTKKCTKLNSFILTISIILCIFIASSLRSNGILIIGFPLYYHIYSNWFISNNKINALSFIRNRIQNILCVQKNKKNKKSSIKNKIKNKKKVNKKTSIIKNGDILHKNGYKNGYNHHNKNGYKKSTSENLLDLIKKKNNQNAASIAMSIHPPKVAIGINSLNPHNIHNPHINIINNQLNGNMMNNSQIQIIQTNKEIIENNKEIIEIKNKMIKKLKNKNDAKMNSYLYNLCYHLFWFFWLILILFIGLIPWFYYHYISKQDLCRYNDSGRILSSRLYCSSTFKTVYTYIQTNYWNCGLFNRWNTNEFGNFLLASPIWYISFHGIKHYLTQFWYISSTKNNNLFKGIVASFWSTINYAIKKLIIKIAKITNNKNNNNKLNNKINNNKIKTKIEHIQVPIEVPIMMNDDHENKYHNNNNNINKFKLIRNSLFNVSSYGTIQFLKSIGIMDKHTTGGTSKMHMKSSKIKSKYNYYKNPVVPHDNGIFLYHKTIPYIIYWLILWVICVLYAHVQITTRFICCACPPIYWFCAEIIYLNNEKEEDNHNHNHNKHNHKLNKQKDIKICYWKLFDITQQPTPKLIINYFLLYFILGTIAFCSFLPFV